MKTIELPIRRKGVKVTGISFREIEARRREVSTWPTDSHVTNMAAELPGGTTRLEVLDYHTPQRVEHVEEAIVESYRAALNGRDVYVHCLGGIGRTGLFLACMAKVAGVEHPVVFTRITYHPHACETEEQEKWVAEFPIEPTRSKVRKMVWKKRFFFWRDV